MKTLLKEYGFTDESQYYDMITESFINGQRKQAIEQFRAIPKQYQQHAIAKLIDSNIWENEYTVALFDGGNDTPDPVEKEKEFLWNDKSGRGFNNTIDLSTILNLEDEFDWDGRSLHEWASDAEEGWTWENASDKYICK